MQPFRVPARWSAFLLLAMELDDIGSREALEQARCEPVKPCNWRFPALEMLIPIWLVALIAPNPVEVVWSVRKTHEQGVGTFPAEHNRRLLPMPNGF